VQHHFKEWVNIMGLLDSLSNIEFKPTPMSLGLLNAGASMLQASNNQPRGVSLGSVLGQGLQGFNTGVGQGVAYNQSQLENQQTDLLRQVQMQEAELKKKKLEQEAIAQEKLKTVDWSLPPKELASKLGELGLTEKAFDLIKQASKGADAPSGWMYGPNGALVPVPVSIPGSPEITNMYDANLAKSQYLTPIQQSAENRAIRKEEQDLIKQEADKYRQIPEKQFEAQVSNNALINKIDNAIAEIDKKPESFGLQNYVPDAIMQRYDPEGVSSRGAVSEIASQKRHDLSGAAVSIQEDEKLKPFLPSSTDDPLVAKQKLEALKKQILDINNERRKTYIKDYGYKGELPGSPKTETNIKGWSLHIDANGNKAYVGPNGEIEEVK
jgi:hypothetical protein